MRVSIQLQNIQTLSDLDLLRVVLACDNEIARCKVVMKTSESALQVRNASQKINKLKEAKATFLSELTIRHRRP